MADTEHPRTPDISTWTQAFAALPQETLPAAAWQRVAAMLSVETRRRHTRPSRRIAWATAAALGIASIGGWMTMQVSQTASPAVAVAMDGSDTAAPGKVAPAIRERGAPPATVERRPFADADTRGNETPAVVAVASDTSPATSRRAVATRDLAIVAARPRSIAATHRDNADAQESAVPTLAAASRQAGMARALDELRGESARLEALVALARQSGMQSGPALVLAADVDDRLQLIDAALSQPALDEAERIDLWGRRVDALSELAAIEGTQRWMASQGYSMDAVARVD